MVQYNDYVNGEKTETAITTRRNSVDSNGKIQQTCTDWYLVTTNFHSDGTTETITTYLFTSCSEDCSLAGRVKRIQCGDGGGGTSSGDPTFDQSSQNRICGPY